MPHTALFVIDIQAYLAENPQTEVPHAARIRDVGQAILSKARAAINRACAQGTEPNLRIVIVQHHETDAGADLIKGSKAWELVFQPQDERTERIVEKTDGELPT